MSDHCPSCPFAACEGCRFQSPFGNGNCRHPEQVLIENGTHPVWRCTNPGCRFQTPTEPAATEGTK